MIRLFACLMRKVGPRFMLRADEDALQLRWSPEGLDLSESFPKGVPIVELDLSERSRRFLEDHELSEGPLQEILEQAVRAGFKIAVKVEELSRK